MSDWNIAVKSEEEREKISVDLLASAIAYKERLNMPVIADIVIREQPEHLRDYFMERLKHYRKLSEQLPNANDPRYTDMAEANKKR